MRLSAYLVLCSLADEPLAVSEGDVGGRRTVALLVRDNLHAVMLPHADTTAAQRGDSAEGSGASKLWLAQPKDGPSWRCMQEYSQYVLFQFSCTNARWLQRGICRG